MARFQVVEVDHPPLTTPSRFSYLLFNTIGNIRQDFYNLPGATPRLKEFLPSCPSSVSIPHSVSNLEPLTMALGIIIGFLRLLCSLGAFSR